MTDGQPPGPPLPHDHPPPPPADTVRVVVDAPPGVSVRVTIATSSDGAPPTVRVLSAGSGGRAAPAAAAHASAWLGQHLRLEWVLFAGALLVYLVTRLVRPGDFPIYFFADEAVNSIVAREVVEAGFRGRDGEWFPLYFEAAGRRWTPLLSMYFHLIVEAFFGRSIFISRATSGVLSLLAAGAVALTLKRVFRLHLWWVGALFVAVTPAWFLHSRTAFETVIMVSFFACFLLCYLLYRVESARWLYAAVAFGAMAFYTYSNGQMLMVACAGLLLISDWRYHWQQRATLVRALGLALILAVPLIAFRFEHPEAFTSHLRTIDSFVFKKIPLVERLQLITQTYLSGLDPRYWFLPNDHDLPRHRMLGYGHIHQFVLPFVAVGFLIGLWKLRSSPHRAVLLAALAVPAGASLVGVGITRVLAMIVPAAIWAALGLDWLAGWLWRRWPRWRAAGAAAIFLVLAGSAIGMLNDALTNGPLWFRDYGLYGMQYGARQLFEQAIPAVWREQPGTRVLVTPTWANGTENFLTYFYDGPERAQVDLLNLDYLLFELRTLSPNLVWVASAGEYEAARTSPKFKNVTVDRIVPYPDGTPGFYFMRLEYSGEAPALFEQERVERRKPVEVNYVINGVPVVITHSRLGTGQALHLFDQDLATVVRGLEANPLVVAIAYSQPQTFSRLILNVGTMRNFTVSVRLFAPGASEPVLYEQTYVNLPREPQIEFALDRGPAQVGVARLEIFDHTSGETAQIHIYEIDYR